jgi:hypothetical protein
MLIKAKTLNGYTLHSLDGEIGKVQEFYFDDKHWAIRYLIANTGNWLTGRQVLISPHALAAVNKEEQSIAVELTKKQIEDSPSLDRDKPVSRQFERAYYGYYGYPMYWGGPYMWGTSYYPYNMGAAGQGLGFAQGVGSYGLGASATVKPNSEPLRESAQNAGTWDAHLRSTRAVSGYHIEAADGPIGHIEDYIIDDETWAIRYLEVDTVNWWPGKKVLVAARWIDRVSWDESKVFINLSRAAIKQAPEYTEESLLTRDYETRLHGHYNRQGYWVDEPVAKEPSSPKRIFKD